MTIEFKPWPKTPRLNRDIVVTEKIDGTNAAVIITESGEVGAQSRNRLITPENDNYGFASWVFEHANDLANILGPGHHYGEWWGSGIQRGYWLTNGDKRFSLFNTHRWRSRHELSEVEGLGVVPTLYHGPFNEVDIQSVLDDLADLGSYANPGYAFPEGICIYHTASKQVYKVLLENDDIPKGLAA